MRNKRERRCKMVLRRKKKKDNKPTDLNVGQSSMEFDDSLEFDFDEDNQNTHSKTSREKAEEAMKDSIDLSEEQEVYDPELAEFRDERVSSLRENLAPGAYYRGHPSYLIVEDRYARTFHIKDFPEVVEIGYLWSLYSNEYDLDINIALSPRPRSELRKELQDKLTIVRASYADEVDSGGTRNLDTYRNQMEALEQQIAELQGPEGGFEAQVFFTLYADSEDLLESISTRLVENLKGDDVVAEPFYLRQDDAWKTVIPYGIDYVKDKKRNFNTGAVVSSIPFFIPELYDDSGVYLGTNVYSGKPAAIDLYKPGITNSNLNIFGASGSGKSTFVKTLTARSVFHGIHTAIIDPEGEYNHLARTLHGKTVRLTSNVNQSLMINIFDVEEEEIVNSRGEREKTLDLKSKYEEVLGFILAAYDGNISASQRSQILNLIELVYRKAHFIDGDPDSLYLDNDRILNERGELVASRTPRAMPQLSDLLDLMLEKSEDGTYPELRDVYYGLNVYREGEVRGLFDTQTPDALKNLSGSRIINFDISGLENSDLRSLAMYVVLSWLWEKFGKKMPEIKKRIVVDEAWMMLEESGMGGSEYTARFLTNMSRRIRKRNGALVVATQKIGDFANSESGSTIITNAHTTFLLSHESYEIDSISKSLAIDIGVAQNIENVGKGRMLIKQGIQLYLVNNNIFKNEKAFITT